MGIVGLVFANSLAHSQEEPQPLVQSGRLIESAPLRSDVRDAQFQDSQVSQTSGLLRAISTLQLTQTDNGIPTAMSSAGDLAVFQGQLQNRQPSNTIGTNFFQTSDDFTQGLVIEGKSVAMKIGGYVKLDLIQDLNAIDNSDVFDVSSIPVDGPQRTNNRMHLRQTRLNFDTRWDTDIGVIKAFVEGDFFGNDANGNSSLRLRQAYGELGNFLGGQTFTTFANIDAAPATLDFEGAISTITIRRAQLRWTQPVLIEALTLATSLEDSSTAIELPPGSTVTGNTRTISPDFVTRLRKTSPNGNIQVAGIVRILGFQPTGEPVRTENAWGFNFSQVQQFSPDDKIYWQINYGEGIASLLGGLPDATPVDADSVALLGYFGWMVGTTHNWNSRLSSNFTFAESHFRNTSGQPSTDINNLNYLAANLIYTPLERFQVGVEYLYGKRENISGQAGDANRMQFAVFYYLP